MIKLYPPRKHAIRAFGQETKYGLLWWEYILDHFQGTSAIPQLDWERAQSDIYIASDASGWGAAAVCGDSHTSIQWLPDPVAGSLPDIHVREMASILLALATFGADWRGLNITIRTDSNCSVDIFHRGYAAHPAARAILTEWSLVAAAYGFNFRLEHLPGMANLGPDLLSRGKFEEFTRAFPSSRPAHPMLPPNSVALQWTISSVNLVTNCTPSLGTGAPPTRRPKKRCRASPDINT